MNGAARGLVLAAALLGAASAAPARAPTTRERAAHDALLRQARKEREEDARAPVVEDAFALYEKGGVPLEDVKAIVEAIKDRKKTDIQRERITGIVLRRFRLEEERRTLEARKIDDARKTILLLLLDLMTEDDPFGRQCVHRLLQTPPAGLLREGPVAWNPADPERQRARQKAEIRKRLTK